MRWSSTVATKFRYSAVAKIPSPPLEERVRERRPFVSKFICRNTRPRHFSNTLLFAFQLDWHRLDAWTLRSKNLRANRGLKAVKAWRRGGLTNFQRIIALSPGIDASQQGPDP